MVGWWEWVQRHLDERGWTPSDLARHAKINRSIIGRWRDGAQPEVRTARAPGGKSHRRRGRKAKGVPCTPNDGAIWLRPRDRRQNR